jgi:hypothetical protein
MSINGMTSHQKSWIANISGGEYTTAKIQTKGVSTFAPDDVHAGTGDIRPGGPQTNGESVQPNYGKDAITHTAGDPYRGYHGEGGVDSGQGFLDDKIGKDPFSFNMRSYPSDITRNPEMGHYMLFYINVQDKTKYIYNGYNKDGGAITVGGVNKRWKEAEYTQVPATYYTASQAADATRNSRTGAVINAGDVKTYKKQKVEGTGKTIFEDSEGTNGPRYIGVSRVGKGGKGTYNDTSVNVLAKSRKLGAQTGLKSYYPTTKRITDSIAIYLPANVKSDLGAGYTDAETGMIGFAAASIGAAIGSTMKDDFEQGARALKGFISTMGKDIFNRAAAGVADAVANFASGGTDGGSYDLVQKAFGRATNPYMEVMFDKMTLRTFSYNFTFQPKNEIERDEAQAIIKLFRFHMAPELQTDNMRFLGIPSTFDIHYMFQTSKAGTSLDHSNAKENQYYNKIATCVLKACDVDYTSDGVKSFRDGSPTTITMNLTFQETEMMTKDKIDQGF